MLSCSALNPCIFAPVPRAACARAFDARLLLFSREQTLRRTVNTTHRTVISVASEVRSVLDRAQRWNLECEKRPLNPTEQKCRDSSSTTRSKRSKHPTVAWHSRGRYSLRIPIRPSLHDARAHTHDPAHTRTPCSPLVHVHTLSHLNVPGGGEKDLSHGTKIHVPSRTLPPRTC